MADFQKQVNTGAALGIPGARASVNPVVSTAKGYIAAVDVPIGGFAFEKADGTATNVGTGLGAPVGFVVREQNYSIYDALSAAANIVPAGQNVSIAAKGDFYAVSATAAAVGQKIFAKTLDGSIAAGDAGATVAGHAETNYEVIVAGAAGDIIVIGNHSERLTAVVVVSGD
jgi:glucose dehydrogenase